MAQKKSLIFDKFDLDSAMAPIWCGNEVINETCMFLGDEGESRLLYDADEIISVRNYSLEVEFKPGIDYVYDKKKNTIKRLKNGNAAYIEKSLYYSKNQAFPFELITKDENGDPKSTYYNEEIYKHQISVTYKHSDSWNRFYQECHKSTFKTLSSKLNKGEDVTFMFLGDSITYGASASSILHNAPNTPTWAQMFTQYLAKKYDYNIRYIAPNIPNTPEVPCDITNRNSGTITYVNTAVGGWQVGNGIDSYDVHIRPFIEKYGCDFFLLGFGMNDANQVPENEKKLQRVIVDKVLEQSPKSAILLLSTMVPNPEAINGWYGTNATFEPCMTELAKDLRDEGFEADIACMTTMSNTILERKKFRDYTGNNINHPNDFFTRVYAQVVYQAVEGY